MGLGLAGLSHEGGDEQVKIAHHGSLVLRLQPAGGVDVGQGCPHPLRVLRVVDRCFIGKGELSGQLMGAGTVEADPAVLPGLLLIRRIPDELAGLGKEQIARRDRKGLAAHLKYAPAGDDQVDEVMVADAGPPGLAGGAALQTTVEDGKFNIIGVALLERLFINVCHCGSLPPVRFLVPVYHNCPCKFNKSTSYSLGWTPKKCFFRQSN